MSEPPKWHPDQIRDVFKEPTPERQSVVRDPFTGDPFTAGGTGGWAETALTNELDQLRSTTEGSRNAALNTAAFSLGQIVAGGGLDELMVATELAATAREIGLDSAEIAPTIRSGLASGKQSPRTAPERKDYPSWAPSSTGSTGPSTRSTGPSTRSAAPWEDTSPASSTSAPSPPSVVGPAAPAAPSGSTPPADPSGGADDPRLAHLERLTTIELYNQRARRDAKAILDAEEALKHFRVPPWRPTLSEELALPDEPISYLVDEVFPTGANVLLTAQFKAGKTTLVDALAKSLADDVPFLNRFPVEQPDGRVALFNYEVDDRQYRRWLRDIGIVDTDRVVVLNLRGYRMPVTVPYVEDWLTAWLTDREVKVWVVDPFARAFTGSGTSENDNTEVGRFLDTLDVIKNRAGVSELLLPTHTGRAVAEEGEERARGATRLDDWADVRWLLNKDADDIRFLRATGRDVEVPEEKLTYDEATRGLTFGGGDRAWEKRRRIADAVVLVVTETPGITVTRLRTSVREKVEKASNDAITSAIEYACSRRYIHVVTGATGGSNNHYPGGAE